MEYFLGTGVSEDAKDFPHAVGEVQMHEHHFKTPGGHAAEEMDENASGKSGGDGGIASHHHDSATTLSHVAGEVSEGHHDSLKQPLIPGVLRKRDLDHHDAAARKIAEARRRWAAKVLRREDALLYMCRLLLEYARIVDGLRERPGWIDDLAGV